MTTLADSDSDSNLTGEEKDYPNHAKIPHSDIDWVLQQSPTVVKLFLESWRCDSFGNRRKHGEPQWKKLTTKLQADNFRKTRKVLEDNGYFKYRKIVEEKEVRWEVWNQRARYSGNWIQNQTENPPTRTENPPTRTENPVLSSETLAPSKFENSQLSTNQGSTTPQQPTKVVEEELVIQPPLAGDPLEGVAAAAPVAQEEEANISTTLDAKPQPSYVPPATQEEAAARREWRDKARKKINTFALQNFVNYNFLESCWHDPLLKVFVRAAIKKRPEWRIVEIDGVLVQLDLPELESGG